MTYKEQSISYEEFLRMLGDGGWVGFHVYRVFYGNNVARKQRLASAIDTGEINFKIVLSKDEEYPVNELKYRSDWKQPVCTYREKDHIRREHIIAYLTYPTRESLRLILEAETFLLWLKSNYPLKIENTHNNSTKEKNSNFSLNELLKLITPEMYQDGLKGQEKSAITKSLSALKEQMPKAFELCSALVMEAMTCKEREEYLQYSRDDIITRAKEKGINRPTALQIYQGLPAMLKK